MRKFIASVALATAVAAAAALLPASSANASTITDVFSFNDGSNVVATGSFSYNSALSGTLTYANLNSFSIRFPAPNAKSYNLSFVNSLNPASAYIYFAYDIGSNTFVPGSVNGGSGPYDGILAGTNQSSGFFFDPLPSQADPLSNGGNDGLYAAYSPYTGNLTFTSFSISQTPLPSTWTMLLAGFVGFGFLAYRGTKKSTALAAA